LPGSRELADLAKYGFGRFRADYIDDSEGLEIIW